MDQDHLATLHRQASTSFLKGDLEAAVATWREVLELQPDDEQAREGIRVCEERADAEAPVHADPPPSTASIDDCLEQLDVKLDLGEPTAPAPQAQPDATGVGESEIALDLPIESEPAPPTSEPAAGSEDASVWQWGISDEDGAHPAGEPDGAGSALAELRRRIEDLLEEARGSLSEGDADQAACTLDRVLILDESNEAALELREQILQSGGQVASPPDTTGGGTMPELDLTDQDDAVIAPAVDRPLPPPPTPASPPEESASDPTDFGDDPPDDQRVSSPASEARDEPAAKVPRFAIGTRQIYMIGGLVLALAVAFLAWKWLGAEDPAPVEPATVAAEKRPPKKQPATPQPAAPVEPEPQDPAVLLQQGDDALQAGDFAAAVIAYDKVLDIQPDNAQAEEKLKTASDLYRDQRARQERWDRAAEEFGGRNYREALMILYRMPEGEDPSRIETNIVAAWYNLGVISLQSRNCPRAITNLDEAQAVDPNDADVTAALGLARDCGRSGSPTYSADVAALTLRSFSAESAGDR